MRRPLCVVCLLFVVTVFLSVCFIPPKQAELGKAAGKTVYLAGKINHKEVRPSLSGEEQSVIYLNHIAVSSESESLFEKQENIEGVVCYMKENTGTPIGSTVVVKGKVQEFNQDTNPGEFDSRQYYQILKLDFRLKDAEIVKISEEHNVFMEGLYQIKEKCSRILEEYYDETDAGIMKTILLGDKNSLSEEVEEQYKRNGIIHIMAISGLHISMLGMGLYKLLKKCRIPTWLAGGVTVLFIWCYGMMTGMSASACRAIIMFVMKITADIIGRTYDLLTALAVAAVLLLIEQPLYVKHCGFLLSFGAVMGIGIVLPILEENMGKKLPRLLSGILPGIAVFLVSFPIQIYYYYQYPIYSITLNLLIIPLMTFVMISGLGMLVIGAVRITFLTETVGAAVVFVGHSILRVYSFLCGVAESLPGSVFITGKPEVWQMVLYYVALGVFLILKIAGKRDETRKKVVKDRECDTKVNVQKILQVKEKKKEQTQKQRQVVCRVIRSVVLGMGFLVLLVRIQAGVEISFLDVGQGDCIYIRSESGKSYLVDGGSTSKSKVGEYQITPFLKCKGVSSLEAVFVTHGDKDHYSGIEELLENTKADRIRIERLVLPVTEKGQGETEEGCGRLKQLAWQQGIDVVYIKSGDLITDGKLKLECLNPSVDSVESEGTFGMTGQESEDKNEQSIVLYLTYGKFSALFTGDVTGEPEQNVSGVMKRKLGGKSLTVLKVAHHGSMYSTDEAFLKNVQPKIAVISCGEKNSYGHPSPETIERLEGCGAEVYYTMKSGQMTLKISKEEIRITEYIRKDE